VFISRKTQWVNANMFLSFKKTAGQVRKAKGCMIFGCFPPIFHGKFQHLPRKSKNLLQSYLL